MISYHVHEKINCITTDTFKWHTTYGNHQKTCTSIVVGKSNISTVLHYNLQIQDCKKTLLRTTYEENWIYWHAKYSQVNTNVTSWYCFNKHNRLNKCYNTSKKEKLLIHKDKQISKKLYKIQISAIRTYVLQQNFYV